MFKRLALATALGLALGALGACASPPDTRESTTVAPAGPIATPNDAQKPGEPLAKVELWEDFPNVMNVRPVSSGPVSSGWVFVERSGQLWYFDGEEPKMILDITDEVQMEAEQGLFDFVVSPDEKYAYVHFTGTEKPYGDNHVREYGWTGSNLEGDGREVIVVENPYPHHNGGQMQFGPDGYLYIAIGDGGTATNSQEADNGDPHGNAQRTDELLGNVLRIDPRPSPGKGYTIPKDNPFVGVDGRDEIWAYGLRNPWRFSFDRQTGDLWLPDVGHRFWEEINFQPASSKGGANYGWSEMEGPIPYKAKGEKGPGLTAPLYAYPHRGGPCAIIGGYSYRGEAIGALEGWYVFGDFCTGELQAIKRVDGEVQRRFVGAKVEGLVAIAEDSDGELFVISISKGIYRLVPADG